MTSPSYAPDAGQKGSGDRHRPCSDCDPELLDDLKCKAKGVEAQAAYNAAHMEALAQARTKFEGARSAYSTARSAASILVKDVGNQLNHLIDQLKCLINDPSVIERIDCAYGRIKERLAACGGKSGCYFHDECDFDDLVRDCDPESVPKHVANIERRTKEAEDCFNDLIQEPTKLPERVAKLQAEVADISSKTGGDPAKTDFKRLYAAALVARQHLKDVWRGFADVNAYVDCLCHALTCILKGHTAIAILMGKAAVHKCQQQAIEEACTRLRENTVDEVMAEYLRICASHRDNESSCHDDDPYRYHSPSSR
ncbi:MAG: hypothetical protein ACRDRV_09390 [Pseudonocardiaceae bacterium]